jgi:peptidoglycan/LPS O-acetylase OafA/YrhL
MGRYIPQLDGLRAIAVLLVIGAHTGYVPGGYVGVDVFFALSGYLITTILLREHADGRWSLKRFYVRRARRLYPALIVLLVVLIPFGGVVAAGHYPAAAAVSATYLSDFAAVVNPQWLGGLTHTWSLGVEEQFYLLWPAFLLFSFRRASRRVIFGSTLALAAVMLVTLSRGGALGHTMFFPTGRGGVLMLGCALALALDRRALPRPGLVASVSAAGLVFAVLLGGDLALGGAAAVVAGIAATGVIAGVMHGGLLARALASGPLVWLGKRSYGIYLWHAPIAYVIDRHTWLPTHGSLRVLIPTLIGGTGFAAVSYRYVETRFRGTSTSRGGASGRPAVEAT